MPTSKLRIVESKSPSALVIAVDDYIAAMKVEGKSPKTLKFGMKFPLVRIFLPWCADNEIGQPEQLDTRSLTRFQAHLMDNGGVKGALKESSVHSYTKAVKGFIAWLKIDGQDVPGSIKLPTLGQHKDIQILTRQEVEKLEETAPTERDKIIVRVLAETGIRRAECAGLQVKDLLEESGRHYLLVHGKGRKDRRVPLTLALARRLRKLTNGRSRDSHVFLALQRQGGEYEPLSDSGITQMITNLGELAGLDKHVTPHLFRHTAATFMLRRGVDSILVAQVLGHSSLQMIQRVYSHMTPTDAHIAVMQALTATDDEL